MKSNNNKHNHYYINKKRKYPISLSSKREYKEHKNKNIKIHRKNTSESDIFLYTEKKHNKKSNSNNKEYFYEEGEINEDFSYNTISTKNKEKNSVKKNNKNKEHNTHINTNDNNIDIPQIKKDNILIDKDFIPFSTETLLELQKENENIIKSKNSSDISNYPWLTKKSKSLQLNGTLKLHYEIKEFYDFIKPNKKERKEKEKVYEYIKNIINKEFPDWGVNIYGSFVSKLDLPISDIDIIITTPKTETLNNNEVFQKILDIFISSNNFSYVELIKARVPIIKAIHSSTNTEIDISVNKKNGLLAIDYIKKVLKICPYIKPIMLVIKYYIYQKKLNETYFGGINSFILFNMIYAYILYIHKRGTLLKNSTNMGTILTGFFNFYAFEFNYDLLGISVRNGGFFYKRKEKKFKDASDKSYLLSLENPQEPDLDLGTNCFKFHKIIDIFRIARDALYYPPNIHIKSYLGFFINNDELLTKRAEIDN